MQHGASQFDMGQPGFEGPGLEMPGRDGARKTRKPKKIPELNVVPMLDVCFNLLIFFISSASFAMGEGVLPADLPAGQGKAATGAEAPQQPIMLMLRSLGGQDIAIEVQGGGAVENFQALYTTLAGLQRNTSNPNGIYMPEDPVIIQPEPTVPWGAVVNAFNAAVRAKFTNVNFAQATKQ